MCPNYVNLQSLMLTYTIIIELYCVIEQSSTQSVCKLKVHSFMKMCICVFFDGLQYGRVYFCYGQMLMRARKICHMSQLLMKPLFAAMIYVRTRGKVALCKRSQYKNVHIYEFIIDIPTYWLFITPNKLRYP